MVPTACRRGKGRPIRRPVVPDPAARIVDRTTMALHSRRIGIGCA
jgi:hypothetical protein